MIVKKDTNIRASPVGTTLTTKVICETKSKDLYSKSRNPVLHWQWNTAENYTDRL